MILAASDLTEASVKLLISFNATWIRVENMVVEEVNVIFLFITVYCFPCFSQFQDMGSVLLECSLDSGNNEERMGVTALIDSDVNLEFW